MLSSVGIRLHHHYYQVVVCIWYILSIQGPPHMMSLSLLRTPEHALIRTSRLIKNDL